MAYYGAGRAWLATNKRPTGRINQRKPQHLDAYRKCLDTRIHDQDLNQWFLFEAAATNGHGKGRPGYRAVRQAVLDCIPEADGLRYDSDLKEIVLSIRGFEQRFYNLSAGQRMMLAMVADIAIKAVTLNSFLLGPNQPAAVDPMQVLRLSPGVVLIDELDVHLHPCWQRQVATDLKRTFPGIQFVCTSHSPQVVGEVARDEVRLLRPEGVSQPSVALGADSNWLLQFEMGAPALARNERAATLIRQVEDALDEPDLGKARERLNELRTLLGGDDGETVRLESTIHHLEDLARAED